MAAAIETLIKNGILNESASPTKDFIKAVNNSLYEINVKNVYSSNPINHPSKRGCLQKIEKLKESLLFLETIKCNGKHVK